MDWLIVCISTGRCQEWWQAALLAMVMFILMLLGMFGLFELLDRVSRGWPPIVLVRTVYRDADKEAVLDQQRVLGQVAAALEAAEAALQHVLVYSSRSDPGPDGSALIAIVRDALTPPSACLAGTIGIAEALILPDVQDALAAWRKEQGQ